LSPLKALCLPVVRRGLSISAEMMEGKRQSNLVVETS
jgi:hypothetical protein